MFFVIFDERGDKAILDSRFGMFCFCSRRLCLFENAKDAFSIVRRISDFDQSLIRKLSNDCGMTIIE